MTGGLQASRKKLQFLCKKRVHRPTDNRHSCFSLLQPRSDKGSADKNKKKKIKKIFYDKVLKKFFQEFCDVFGIVINRPCVAGTVLQTALW